LEKAVALDVEKEKVDIKNNIIIAVLNLYKIQQTRRALDSQIYVLENRQNDVKNFVKQGTVLENDLLKVDLALVHCAPNNSVKSWNEFRVDTHGRAYLN
jgi:hypothetical protein